MQHQRNDSASSHRVQRARGGVTARDIPQQRAHGSHTVPTLTHRLQLESQRVLHLLRRGCSIETLATQSSEL